MDKGGAGNLQLLREAATGPQRRQQHREEERRRRSAWVGGGDGAGQTAPTAARGWASSSSSWRLCAGWGQEEVAGGECVHWLGEEEVAGGEELAGGCSNRAGEESTRSGSPKFPNSGHRVAGGCAPHGPGNWKNSTYSNQEPSEQWLLGPSTNYSADIWNSDIHAFESLGNENTKRLHLY